MNDFDYDVLQKKRIASGAFHKKNGSKSKGCTLPSDYLTAAEKRKLNGEVKTLELDKPRTWVEFRAMPDSEKIMYLEFLRSKYQPSARMLAAMFGASRNAVDCECKRLKHDTGYRRGEKVSETDKFNWRVFLGGSIPEEVKEPIPVEAEETTVVEEPTYNCESASVWVYATPQEVAQLLLMLSGERRRKFHITFSEVEE